MGISDVGKGLGRNLDSITNNISKSFNRLSSGKRINTAADDAAGLAIADALKSTDAVLRQASRNISDGESLSQIQDGVYTSLTDIGTRLQELSTQSANGTLSDTQRSALNQEFQQLSQEANRIVQSTTFNGQQVFSGQSTNIQVGLDSSASSQVQLTDPGLQSVVSSIQSLSIGTANEARSAIDSISSFVSNVTQSRGQLGAQQSRLDYANSNALSQADNAKAAESRIRDVDIADETANLLANRIKQDATTSLSAQAGKIQASLVQRLFT